MPVRPLTAVALPLAGLALGVVLQRASEGALPAGDALLRWVAWASGAGLLCGVLAAAALGRARAERLAWAAWGLVAPALVCGCATAGASAVRPVRVAWAAHLEAGCRAQGRGICTVREFQTACAAPGGQGALGPPASRTCAGGACTTRWRYEGPAGPDDELAARTTLVCQLREGGGGRGPRALVLREESE